MGKTGVRCLCSGTLNIISLGSEERRVLLETRVMVGVTLEVT